MSEATATATAEELAATWRESGLVMRAIEAILAGADPAAVAARVPPAFRARWVEAVRGAVTDSFAIRTAGGRRPPALLALQGAGLDLVEAIEALGPAGEGREAPA